MTKNTTNHPAPEGYSTVCPYLMVESVEEQLEFLKQVFDAEIVENLKQADGYVAHGEARIGNAVIMMGRAQPKFPARVSMNYVYVDDVDAMYARALQQGATSIMEPGDRYYGYRECGLEDAQGNQWWMAQVVEQLSMEELEKRTFTQRREG